MKVNFPFVPQKYNNVCKFDSEQVVDICLCCRDLSNLIFYILFDSKNSKICGFKKIKTILIWKIFLPTNIL
ncbi:MAG: hypothetical protein A3G95_06985 [Flavobacteria bacterium RIFCSPLOWO2_12_FULL_31_7]|nr:MAG: hypothetical protein A3G95_06985 [Flavobacteria bacterium RIFCSPLOWO2_12_FULL_31_7]